MIPANDESVLWLVQRDSNTLDANGKPRMVGAVGCIVKNASGYRFYPNGFGRKPSKIDHPTAKSAVPGWAMKCARAKGCAEFLSLDELREALAISYEN